jgi:hypothetical protein
MLPLGNCYLYVTVFRKLSTFRKVRTLYVAVSPIAGVRQDSSLNLLRSFTLNFLLPCNSQFHGGANLRPLHSKKTQQKNY